MARIFVSHSSHDNAVAADIMQWLRTLGFDNAFLDIDERRGIAPGERWEARLYEELSACSAVVLLVTPNWLASKWCFAEFVQARATGKAIFPIIMTPDGGQMFAGDLQRVDFTADRESGQRRLAQRLKDLALDVQSGFEWDPRRPPYPGLPAFEREDAAVYFGRDAEVRELIDRLRARRTMGGARMVVVLGASGSGKSSLVRAGVLPRLARFETDFVPLPPLRPGDAPVAELAKSLAEALGRPAQWADLRERLQHDDAALPALFTDVLMAAGRREATVLVTVDQAEELFTTTAPAARARFETLLRQAMQARALVLLTLRSDQLGALQSWALGVGAFEQFSLPPLPASRLSQVIEGPARVAGVAIAPGVVDAVMHDAGGADAMPLLAFTLRELWSRAQADAGVDGPVIRLADYAALGDPAHGLNPLENAVSRRADELAAAWPADGTVRRAVREAFVGALARIDDSGVFGRRAADWDEIEALAQGALQAFVQARLLVVRSGSDGRPSVEVAHEALLRKWPLLVRWLEEERSFLLGRLQLQRALADWQEAQPGQRDSALLQGLMLARARVWLADKPGALSPAQRDYVAASVARADALHRAVRRRRLALGVGAAAVVAVVAGLGVYLQQARQAASALALDVEANLWLQRSAAALASGQPDRALAQAAQAYAVLPSEKTRSAVWQAGVAMAPALAFSFPAVARDGTPARATTVGAVSALAWEASMEGLLMGDRAGTLQGLRFTPTPALTALAAERRGPPSKDRPEAVLALQRLADGSLLAVLEDGRILRQRSAGAPFDLAGQVDALAAAAVNETGDGLLVLTQSARQAHWVRCAPGGGCRLQEALSGLGAVTTIALEARSGQLVVADESGRLLVGSSAEPAALRPVRVDWPAATRVHALALRADGQRLAVAGSTGEVVVLDADDRELARLSTQGAAVQRLAWSPDGRLLAGDCEVESLCVWRSAADGSLSLAAVLAVRGGGAGALAWSGDARRLAAGDLGGRLHVWDLAAAPGRAAVLRAAGVGPLADIDVHADGRRIVAADVRGRAVVWDLPSQQVQQRLAHALAGETRSVRFHPVQPRLALATLGGGVAVLGLDAAAEPTLLEGSIEVLRWQPATGRLLTGGQDGVLRSHAVGTGQAEVLPEPHADAVIALAVAPAAAGSAPLVYTADTRGVVRSHGAETATVATAVNAAGRPFGVGSLSFSADGNAWLASGNSGEVLIFDRASRQLRARLDTGADQVNAAAYSPDGRYVAAIDNVGRLHVWHADTLRALASLWLRNEPGRVGTDSFGLVGQLRGLAWLPDSRRVAIASQSGVVLVLAVPTEDGLPTAR